MNIYQSLTKQVGVTNEVNVCSCCGKTNLKKTVVFKVEEESEAYNLSHVPGYVFLGATCAYNVKKYALSTKKNNTKISLTDLAGEAKIYNNVLQAESKWKLAFTGSDVQLVHTSGDFWSLLGARGKAMYFNLLEDGSFIGENNRVFEAIKSWAAKTRNTENLKPVLDSF